VERGSESKSRYHCKVYPALTTRTIGYNWYGLHSSLLLFVDHVCRNYHKQERKLEMLQFLQIMTVVLTRFV